MKRHTTHFDDCGCITERYLTEIAGLKAELEKAQVGRKECYRCKKMKTVDHFYKDSTRFDGLESRCKKCEYDRKVGTKYSREKQRRYRTKYPQKTKAHYIVNRLKHLGKLKPDQRCADCLEISNRPNAHHPDYKKPTEVVWLCPKCHTRRHQ